MKNFTLSPCHHLLHSRLSSPSAWLHRDYLTFKTLTTLRKMNEDFEAVNSESYIFCPSDTWHYTWKSFFRSQEYEKLFEALPPRWRVWSSSCANWHFFLIWMLKKFMCVGRVEGRKLSAYLRDQHQPSNLVHHGAETVYERFMEDLWRVPTQHPVWSMKRRVTEDTSVFGSLVMSNVPFLE